MKAAVFGLALIMSAAGAPAWSGERGIEILKAKSGFAHSHYNFDEAVIKLRYARINKIRRWQVQMPSGGWRDCGHDCAEFYRCQVFDFWECQSETAGGRDYD